MTVERIQWKRGTAAQWTTNNQVLALAEVGYERDTGKVKIGDGVSTWTALAYATFGISGGAGITVQDEGAPLTTAVTLFNFAGAGVTVTEPTPDQVLVTIPASSTPSGAATITIIGPARGTLEWNETVAAVGLVSGSRVFVQLAPPDDMLENDPEMLDIAAMSAACLANDTLTVTMAFTTPTRGPISLLYGVL